MCKSSSRPTPPSSTMVSIHFSIASSRLRVSANISKGGSLYLSRLRGDLLHQRVRIAFVLANLRGQPCQIAITELHSSLFEHGIAQHLDQTLLPVLDALVQRQIFLLQIRFIIGNRAREFLDSHTLAGDGLDDWRRPAI